MTTKLNEQDVDKLFGLADDHAYRRIRRLFEIHNDLVLVVYELVDNKTSQPLAYQGYVIMPNVPFNDNVLVMYDHYHIGFELYRDVECGAGHYHILGCISVKGLSLLGMIDALRTFHKGIVKVLNG